MAQVVDEVTVQRPIPVILEGLRVVSGLIVVLAVLALLLGAMLRDGGDEQAAAETPASDAGAESDGLLRRLAAGSLAPRGAERVMVYYLVRSPEQAQFAERGENEAAKDAFLADYGRSFQVFYARDDAELDLVARTVLDGLLNREQGTDLEIIDLREVAAGPASALPAQGAALP